MSKINKRRAVAAAAAIPLVVATVGAVSSTTASAAGRHLLPGTTPSWANARARNGNASGSEQIQGRVWLQYNNSAEVDALARAVSDPKSPSYRHFLSAAQFNALFRPTDAQVGAVTAWLAGSGLNVASVPSSHRWVDFSGPSSKVASAFGVSYATYRYDGSTFASPTADASVPGSLTGEVLTVTGLDTKPHMVTPARSGPFPPESGFRNASPCSSFYGEKPATTLPAFNGQTLPYAVCGYTPPQLRAIYHQGDLTGTGATVAITDAYASPTIAADAAQYVANNDPTNPYADGQLSQWTASNFTQAHACGGNGWYGEETLDVEAVHAIAPGANIRYYGAASCSDSDLDAAIQQAMDDGVNVITNSWGEPELSVTAAAAHAESNMFKQAALTGISVLFSSGDSGDEAANLGGTTSADLPAASPWVTAVGGTSLGIGQGGSLVTETGWGTSKYSLSSDGTWTPPKSFQYGSGGGTSAYFNFGQSDAPQLDYQAGDTGPTQARVVPDIALDADPTTGMLVGETQRFGTTFKSDAYGEYRIGGTSLASPLFAGVMALAVEANGGGFGLVNPAIYANQDNASAIRDVLPESSLTGNVRVDYVNGLDATNGVVYSVRTFDQDSSLHTLSGYDMVTGVGSPASGFAQAIVGPAYPSNP